MSKPLDIDDKEIILHHRRKRIEEILLQCYAREIASVISRLVVENCNGCHNDHHSQRHHQCLMMEKDEQLCMYFDEALSKISEENVTRDFNANCDIKLNGLEMLKYTRVFWRSTFCTDHRWALKRETMFSL